MNLRCHCLRGSYCSELWMGSFDGAPAKGAAGAGGRCKAGAPAETLTENWGLEGLKAEQKADCEKVYT